MGASKWPQSSALSLLLFTGGPKWAVRINRSYWLKTNKKRFDTNTNRKFDFFCVIKNNDFQYTTQNGWMIAILVTLLLLVIPNWARFLVGGFALEIIPHTFSNFQRQMTTVTFKKIALKNYFQFDFKIASKYICVCVFSVQDWTGKG